VLAPAVVIGWEDCKMCDIYTSVRISHNQSIPSRAPNHLDAEDHQASRHPNTNLRAWQYVQSFIEYGLLKSRTRNCVIQSGGRLSPLQLNSRSVASVLKLTMALTAWACNQIQELGRRSLQVRYNC
jgi:hypothetical protein